MGILLSLWISVMKICLYLSGRIFMVWFGRGVGVEYFKDTVLKLKMKFARLREKIDKVASLTLD